MGTNKKITFSNALMAVFAIGATSFMVSCQPPANSGGQASNSPFSLGLDHVPAQIAANTKEVKGEYVADLTAAPNVPKPIDRNEPMKVIVEMESVEMTLPLAHGVDYASAWTFNGTIPGPMVRVREGDMVEVHHANAPENKMAHNIDFHAATGPGGGAEASMTAPGKNTVFQFRALLPGLFIYHCAAPPVPEHIANGMYGLILVEPKMGLKPVDKEFYIVQSEFYTSGKFGEEGTHTFNIEKGIAENPDYVVFNGSVGSIANANALQAKVGDKIRLFVGNAGPNLTSSFHVIGEVFDNQYSEAGVTATHNVQTTLIPAGGATIVEFTVEVPGIYNIVDHSIFRTFNKGSLGQIKVTGDENPSIFSGKIEETDYKQLYHPKN